MKWNLKHFIFMFKLEEIPVYFIENKNLLTHYGLKDKHIAFLTKDSNDNPMIVITELFFQFQEKYKIVILYHEIGHYRMKNRQLSGINKEYAADAYAIFKTNYTDVIGALEHAITFYKDSPANIYARISNIKRFFKL